ncbi:nucleotide exchange factor GrpE [Alkalicoccus halolimnae]|uniref:Protein GrpE n=1 Tax=Alkalicoccus halolimnae TaxID=1667239 RepID=A0AAJ8N1T7_9BACI|nr:nucleotide exchange factor GrpE [Alkalicoccus halolimnae]
MSKRNNDDVQDLETEEASAAETAEETTELEEEASVEETEIDQLKQQVQDLEDRLLRLQAEYDNFRRRTKKEKESAAKYKSQSLAESLLPALDNFERALMINPETEEAKSLLQGMKMVHNQLSEALQSEEIEIMETVGQPFDPHMHEAVMQVESDEYDSNIIVEELQKGYLLKDKVIRPAMVKVSS